MNHSKKLKENDVVVFNKDIGDIKVGDIGLIIQIGFIMSILPTSSICCWVLTWQLKENMTGYVVLPYEIEKIGEL